MDHPRHIVCVSGLFTNREGKVLLVKTPRRGWETPGGQVELGESLLEALVREVREESTCEVSVERLVSVCSNVAQPEMVIFMFTGAHVSGVPRASDETIDAGWFDVEQALACVTAPGPAARLRDALDPASRPLYRVYSHAPFAVRLEQRL